MTNLSGRSRVLVVSPDSLPLPGFATTGAGLRAWGLGEGLRSRGHDVTYAMAKSCGEGRALPTDPPLVLYGTGRLAEVVERIGPDVVVCQHWPPLMQIAALDVPIAVDFHGPLMLETVFQGRSVEELRALTAMKLQSLQRADFFICAGEFQKKYYLAWLLMAGVELTRQAMQVVPVSMAPDLPEHTWPEPEVNFVYGGVFLPWQDPTVGLKALVQEMERSGRGRLDFFGGKHVVQNVPSGIIREVLPVLRSSSHVRIHGMIPRDRLVQHYLSSYAAIDVMARNPERELAFTTRTVEYLWCGLAVVYADYGELSPLIRDYEAGWIVSADDPKCIASTLREMLDNPTEVSRRGKNAQRLARERLAWDRTIAPLDAFCRGPVRRRGNPALVRPPGPWSHRVALARYAIGHARREGLVSTICKTWSYLRHA
jgi:glycosyltransferase involved in cell wall biosynthesis